MAGIDPTQLAGWFEAYGPRLVLYARQWVEEQAAQDAVQETFARLMAQGRPPERPLAWLFRSVRNAALELVRKGRRRQRGLEEFARSSRPLFEADPADLLDAATGQQALDGLDEDRREVVVLKVWGGLALREIAAITGRPISTLSHQYRSALDDIRKRMGEPCQTKKD